MEATALARPTLVRLEASLAWMLPGGGVSAAPVAFLLLALHPVDVAASTYRADLFAAHGFALWNGNWYGGDYNPSHSVPPPPPTWLVGSVPLLIASAVASTALFQTIVRRHFGPAALAGSVWFALTAGTLVYHGRVTFAAGAALALAAVLALQRGHERLAVAGAVLCGLTSPVAGIFVALAGVSTALADRRRAGYAIAAGALVPVLLIQLAFPEGGQQPYRGEDL